MPSARLRWKWASKLPLVTEWESVMQRRSAGLGREVEVTAVMEGARVMGGGRQSKAGAGRGQRGKSRPLPPPQSQDYCSPTREMCPNPSASFLHIPPLPPKLSAHFTASPPQPLRAEILGPPFLFSCLLRPQPNPDPGSSSAPSLLLSTQHTGSLSERLPGAKPWKYRAQGGSLTW